ncbi:MAG: glycerophosphodiester phosphodiesterase [Alphaproteobacteria bacterium]|nr:glycerophosphodiester phosphodiesterase [Alphaproteobacteria bacterium]
MTGGLVAGARFLLVLAVMVAAGAALAFDLQGHRGARALMPENTLPAFQRALAIGVTTLELDVGMTKDGVLVIHHDRRLNPDMTRGPDGEWLLPPTPLLGSLTLAELKAYDVGTMKPGIAYARQFSNQVAVPGTRVPSLAELFQFVRRSGNETVRFNIETKLSPLAPDETPEPGTFARALVAALREHGMANRATVQSFDWRTLKVVQTVAPFIPTVYLTIESGANPTVRRGDPKPSPWTGDFQVSDFGGSVPGMIRAAGGRVWSPFHRDPSDEALREAKALGLAVVVWTVNDPADMAKLIQRGVDGIISDRPDLVREVMARMGLALPPETPVTP